MPDAGDGDAEKGTAMTQVRRAATKSLVASHRLRQSYCRFQAETIGSEPLSCDTCLAVEALETDKFPLMTSQ